MTHQHFNALADSIGLTLRDADYDRAHDPYGEVSEATHTLIVGYLDVLKARVANDCASFNPGFDKTRFYEHIDRVRTQGLNA